MKTVMNVSLGRLQNQLDDNEIVEHSDRFETPFCLGGGRTLMFSCPKELPIEAPDVPINPFEGVIDKDGKLAEFFGGEYQECIVNFLPGTYFPAAGDQPARLAVDVTMTSAEAVMVKISWPLQHPPVNVGLDSEFGRRYHAIAYFRADQADPECNFAPSYGTDIWIMPLSALPPFQAALAARVAHRETETRFAIKSYLMSAPYYREALHEEAETAQMLGLRLEYGDEWAQLIDRSGTTIDVYYDRTHLKALRNTLMKIMEETVFGSAGIRGLIISM